MKNQKDPMGDRFKRYEAATQLLLPRRTYTIMRLDGKAFHTVLRDADKPFDEGVASWMDQVSEVLCTKIQGTVFAYTQSDEISLLLQDFGAIDTQAWFDGNVQKMVSISAAIASTAVPEKHSIPGAIFDSRVFTISDPVEVANYFIWRQRDSVRNSILATAQAHFGPKRIHGVNTSDLVHMLDDEGVHWYEMPGRFTHGALTHKYEYYVDPIPPAREAALRTAWRTDPIEDGWTVDRLMPMIPPLHVGEDAEREDEQAYPGPAKGNAASDSEGGHAAQDRGDQIENS